MHLVSYRYVKETEENALFEINRLETENKSLVIHKPKVLGGKVKCKYLGFICCCDGAMINYQLGIFSERMIMQKRRILIIKPSGFANL